MACEKTVVALMTVISVGFCTRGYWANSAERHRSTNSAARIVARAAVRGNVTMRVRSDGVAGGKRRGELQSRGLVYFSAGNLQDYRKSLAENMDLTTLSWTLQ